MAEYVALVTFPENATTYQAFSALKTSPVSSVVDVAAIVEKDAAGKLSIPEGYNGEFGAGLGTGSLIGALVGVLGGPLGVLLGWGLGAGIGALSDSDRAEGKSSALLEFSQSIPAQRNVLALQTVEDDPRALDDFAAHYNGQVARRPLDEVIAEVEAAEAASRQAAAAAEKELKEQKKQERKESREARIAAIKKKFV